MELSVKQKVAVISLLFKNGDIENIENWRPLSILNNDYKLLTRVLALRLQKVLPLIINEDQQGYIKGRFIGNNIRQISDIIDYCETNQINGALLFLDFKKAFDTVEPEFLFKTLEKFKFKETFIRWIKSLYNNISATILNNGWMSENFELSRGLRQGCCVSSLLFVIVVEVLAISIRNNPRIKGVPVKIDSKHHDIKLTQFADDTTNFIKDNDDLNEALSTIKIFGKYSGLLLNIGKTKGVKLDYASPMTFDNDEIEWKESVKALGTFFSKNKTIMNELNWDSKIEKCKNAIDIWKKRNLTLYGRLTVIKSILIPKFTYLAQSLYFPAETQKRINSLLFKYLWNDKNEKIRRNILINSTLKGGLNMIHLESFTTMLQLKWVKALLSDTKANWKIIPKYFLNRFGANFLIFYSNPSSLKSFQKQLLTLPLFYKNLLSKWLYFRNNGIKQPKTFAEIRSQLLWGNDFIKHNNRVLTFHNWIKSDILFINDILNEHGKIDENVILEKLHNKSNWMSEISIIKSSIPVHWTLITQTNESTSTKVKTSLILFHNSKVLSINKSIYKYLLENTVGTPYIHNFWETKFNSTFNWKNIYSSLNSINDNRYKQFRYKLVNNIIPTGENLFRWKIKHNNNCTVCNTVDNLEHFFLTCSNLESSWNKLMNTLKCIGISKDTRNLKNIVIGYNNNSTAYDDINLIFTIFGFSVYKAYIQSNNRTQPMHVLNTFIYELNVMKEYFCFKKENVKLLKSFIKHL